MSIRDDIVKMRRAGKTLEAIRESYGFASTSSVTYYLGRAKIRSVRLTEGEIVLLRSLIVSTMTKPTSEFEAEALWNINEALKQAEVKK